MCPVFNGMRGAGATVCTDVGNERALSPDLLSVARRNTRAIQPSVPLRFDGKTEAEVGHRTLDTPVFAQASRWQSVGVSARSRGSAPRWRRRSWRREYYIELAELHGLLTTPHAEAL